VAAIAAVANGPDAVIAEVMRVLTRRRATWTRVGDRYHGGNK